MRRLPYQAVLLLACVLSACSSTTRTRTSADSPYASRSHFDPARDPYWEDPQWDAAFLNAVQSVVHNPVDASDLTTPGLRATVKFTFSSGIIEYPEIIQSTGNPDLDKLMLHQVTSAQIPQPTGLHADEPHEFVLELDMPTPLEAFTYTLYPAVDFWKVYPKDAVIHGDQGSATVGFDYLDGKASNVVVAKSSKVRVLDQASVQAVTRSSLPLPPAEYVGKTLHMQVVFCYSLNESNACPAIEHSVQVRGTRIMRTTTEGLP